MQEPAVLQAFCSFSKLKVGTGASSGGAFARAGLKGFQLFFLFRGGLLGLC